MENKYYIFILILISFSMSLEISHKGELISNVKLSDSVSKKLSLLESSFCFLPTLSILRDVDSYSSFDLEYAFQVKRVFKGSTIILSKDNNYRLWLRYLNEKLEIRIGLQKIIFGPSQILRSLSWFDNYSIKDPTSQTKGVTALRYKYFMNNSFDFTFWLIKEQSNKFSLGSRINLSSRVGQWAFTYHRQAENTIVNVTQIGIANTDSHDRYAIDYRFDGLFGFWFEGVVHDLSNKLLPYGTAGIDYTLNIFNGIHFLTETMIIENIDKQFYSAFLLSKPIHFLHKVMLITQIDWNNKNTYNYFQWNTSFDRLSINYILSINTQSLVFSNQIENIYQEYGIGHKIMFIYNY